MPTNMNQKNQALNDKRKMHVRRIAVGILGALLLAPMNTLAVVQATVSFPSTNAGFILNPGFGGLSYEKATLTGSLLSANDLPLVGMFSQVPSAVLRIGGNSVDTTCWGGLSNSTPITAAEVDTLAGFVKALPANWRVIYGINYAVNNPTNCAAEAAYAATALGSRLLGFEIGNEPDDYAGNGLRPANFTYARFLSGWQALAAGITNAVPGWAVTNGGNGWVLTGPANSWDTADYTVPFATNEAGVVSMLTQHFYLADGQSTNATMAYLLQQPEPLLLARVTNGVPAAVSANLPLGYRVGECGSFYNGGAPGISDAFGSALWTLDFMFTVALNGGQGVNLQTGGNSAGYTPIADNGTTVVEARPEFYGLKLFSLLPPGSVVPAAVSLTSNVNFSAYGVRQTNGWVTAVLNNKDGNNTVQTSINLGTTVTAVQLMQLAGASLYSTNGIMLGGAPINADGSWTGGVQSIFAVTNGQVNLAVPPASALWLHPVWAGPTNAYLTSLALTPAGTLSPGFTTNNFTYWVTNNYGQMPGVTVTNADLLATNTLIFNGNPLGLLASGATSTALPLTLGVTNRIQVLVTAQNGSTNVYNLNLIVAPPAAHKLTWTTTSNSVTDGAGTWNQNAASLTAGGGAWYNGSAYGQGMASGDNLIFGGGSAGTGGVVTIGTGGITPGNLTMYNAYDGTGYTLGNSGDPAITMSGGIITNASSAGTVANCPVNGSFAYAGTYGNLVIAANGSQTPLNSVTVKSGTLQIGNNGSAGALGAAVITNNGSLSWKRNSQGNPVCILNAIYGSGSVRFWGNGATFVIQSNLYYSGGTTIQPAGSAAAGSWVQPGGSNVLSANSSVIFVQNGANATNVAMLDLCGFSQTISSLTGDQYATTLSEVITNSSAIPATLTLAGAAKASVFGGQIGGNLNLSLGGGGSSLTLSNVNTYSGTTTINAGTLSLKGGGSIAGSAGLILAGGGILDVSALSSAFNLASGQTLGNSTAGAVINGAFGTGTGLVALNYNGVSPCFILTNGGMTLGSNTVFTVNNSGAQLAVGGSYKLIAKTAAGNPGLVAGTVPAALTVGGNGTKGTASLVITGGELYLSVAPGLPEAGTNLLFTVTDSQLNLSWPSNYTGWLLQSNSVSLADSNGWFTVPGSTAANHAQIRFAPGNASVFYRLAHP